VKYFRQTTEWVRAKLPNERMPNCRMVIAQNGIIWYNVRQMTEEYSKRIADGILADRLEGTGAVLVEGPKWCGKTTTCEQIAKSVLYMGDPDSRQRNLQLAEIGNGNLCWDHILATAEKTGVKHYVVEQDSNFDGTPFNSLRMSAEFLAKYRK